MKTVLIVDDEFGIAEALSALLGDDGYHVVTALNGKQGLEMLAHGHVDLVIVDYMMPVMNGLDMLRAMRAHDSFKHLPVIFMSGAAEATVREECQDYSAFLRKPFNALVMLRLVAKLLR